MSDHSVLAPSAAPQWAHCAASVQMQRQYPGPEGEAAKEGTAAHHAFAELLRGDPWPEGAEYTDDMRGYIEPAADYVKSIIGNSGAWVEERLAMRDIHPAMWGTADVVSIHSTEKPPVLRVFDLKYGWGVVNDFENWQLVSYAAGALERLNLDHVADWTIELHIIQPRPYHRDGPYRRWVLSYPHLSNKLRHLRSQAEEAMGNDPLAHPGPYCKHCTARHACKALQGVALDAIEQASDSTPVELPPAALGSELARLVWARDRLDARITGLEAQVETGLAGGVSIPGWSVERAPGREEWVKPVAEVLTLGTLYGAVLSKPGAITPAQARKAGVPAEVVAAYAARKPGSAKLVQISTDDARRAFGGE